MTRTAWLFAVSLLLVACGSGFSRSVPKAEALQELPRAEEVAFIEIMDGVDSPLLRIEDPRTIAAAIEFLQHDLTEWTALTNTPISHEGVFAAFVRKSNLNPCAFFVESDHIVVAGDTSGGEAYASPVTIRRFKTILGVAGK